MSPEPQPNPDPRRDDLAEYRSEIRAVVAREREHLAAHALGLEEVARDPKTGTLDARVVDLAREAVRRADRRLRELEELSIRCDRREAFNGLITFAGCAFRESVAARTLLLRHTPTLAGVPVALDPRQNHRLNPGSHIIDYARNAYLQFQDARAGSPRMLVDHPILAECAASIARTLHGDDPRVRSVLFSSAIGAIDSLIDVLVAANLDNGRTIALGRRCWFEIGQYVAERFPSRLREIDEHVTPAILDAIDDPEVAGIVLEPLGNHPDMPVVDLDAIARHLASNPVGSPKLLIIDAVHTPDLGFFARWFRGDPPAALSVAVVASGVKFLQAGWDISKAGHVALIAGRRWDGGDGPDLVERLVETRSVAGRAPSFEEAMLADLETPAGLRSRLARYDANTRHLATQLDGWLRDRRLGSVRSPWLPTHDRHELAMACHRTGGRVVFVSLDPGRIDESELGTLFRELAQAAEDRGVHLVTAPSFGLAVPHVHVVIRPGLATTLRLSPGSTDRDSVDRLVDLLRGELGRRTGSSPALEPPPATSRP